jgi:anti-sigma regulatory factor (Ser/Thr protein kinase)
VTPAATTLPPEAESVPVARRFVRESLIELDAVAATADAQVLISELATNAVLHARTAFTVEVSRVGAIIRVCVRDESPVPPRTRDYGTDSTTGRGMRLIASMATDWGVQQQSPGKAVWFELPASGLEADIAPWDDADVDVDALLAGFADDAGAATASAA